MKLSILAVKITVFARKKEFSIKTYFYRFLDKMHALNHQKMSINSRELPPPFDRDQVPGRYEELYPNDSALLDPVGDGDILLS